MDRNRVAASGKSSRRRWTVAAVAVVVIAGAAGGYLLWKRSNRPVIPAIQTAGLEAPVVAAIDQARAEIEQAPDSAEAWGNMGLLLFAHDLYADSQPFLEHAEQLDATDVRWPYFQGLNLLLRQPEQGVDALQRAARISPNNPTVKLRLAEALMTVDRPDEAEKLFRQVLEAEPRNPRASLGRAQIFGRRGQWKEAVEPLKAAIDSPTSRKAAHAALAEAYLHLGNQTDSDAERVKFANTPPDQAWPDPFISDAAKLQRGLKSRLARANNLIAAGQFEPAMRLLQRLITDYPDSAEAHLAIAKAMLRLNPNLNAEAETHLLRAVELDPHLAEGQFLLGGIHLLRNEYAEAESCYRRAIELSPGDGLMQFQLGYAQLQQGNKAGAIAAWRAAAKLRPDLAQIHLALGELLLQDNQVHDAIESLQTAVKLDPNNRAARDKLAQAQAKK